MSKTAGDIALASSKYRRGWFRMRQMLSTLCQLCVAGLLTVLPLVAHAQAPRPRHVTAATLTRNQAELLASSMDLFAQSFDKEAHLIRRPAQSNSNARGGYLVRESSWYAVGLLLRDKPGDRDVAAAILRTVLANQYVEPGPKWYGTFKRSPEEQEPATGTAAFTGYDPNWRHFIGTTFQVVLIAYADRIPADLAAQLQRSIEIAVQGEIEDGRLKESYSNIALMYGALWEFAAQRNGNSAWRAQAAQWNAEVYRLFREHNTFAEYNAPTYYGVDLYGLALWVRYGSRDTARMGAIMQRTLWRDIADFYQPQLRNLCGPYDRSYGMDMERYVSVTGVWLRSVLPATQAPLPESLTLTTDHVADLWFAPFLTILGTGIPSDAMAKFQAFAGPHFVTRTIDDERTATAWVGRDLIYGGEVTHHTKDAGHATQFHPVTVQWRTPAGSIGWLSLTQSPAVDAIADRTGITVTTEGDVDFMLRAEGLVASSIQNGDWSLPGLTVRATSDGTITAEPHTTEAGENGVAVHFHHVSRIRLDLLQQTPLRSAR